MNESVLVLFGQEIPLYGLLFYTGIALSAATALLLCKRRGVERFDVAGSAVYCMIGAVIGAKLLFLAVTYRELIALQLPLINIIRGGFVFYGGLLGGIAGLLIYAKQFRYPFGKLADLYAVVLPLGHAVGRVGCFFAGCCYGVPYDGLFNHVYTAVPGDTPLGIPLFPVQLLESALLLCLFGVQLALYLHSSGREWLETAVYALVYPTMRFFLEFLRGDAVRGVCFGLSTSQWISLAAVAAVCCALALRRRKRLCGNA